jgi:hypothetical protein
MYCPCLKTWPFSSDCAVDIVWSMNWGKYFSMYMSCKWVSVAVHYHCSHIAATTTLLLLAILPLVHNWGIRPKNIACKFESMQWNMYQLGSLHRWVSVEGSRLLSSCYVTEIKCLRFLWKQCDDICKITKHVSIIQSSYIMHLFAYIITLWRKVTLSF